LLSRLDQNELREFACKYGNEIGRRQRCAGDHYLETIDVLKKQHKFDHIAGKFIDIKETDQEIFLEYLDTETQKNIILDEPVHIIINCVGSMNFKNENIPLFFKNVIKKGYCVPNQTQIGFDVNSNFETTANLHVMGPLLAGNIIDNKPIWHVEHCGRIMWLSKLLVDKVFNQQLTLKED
jgi:uncharacterized NAD(P)/FAD-binding protein YdhS